MRIFLIMDGNGPEETTKLISTLKDEGHEILYWVGVKTGVEKKYPDIIFHSHFDARAGIPAKGIDINLFPPPGKKLLHKLYRTESVVMTMPKRKQRLMYLPELRHFYYQLIRYWLGIIHRYKPDIIIFTIVPHAMYSYVINSIARLLHIKMLMFDDTWISDRALIYNDVWEGSKHLEYSINNNEGTDFKLTDLSKDIQEYYLLHTDKTKDATPLYINRHKKESVGIKLLIDKVKVLLHIISKKTTLSILSEKLKTIMGPSLVKEYRKLESKPDFSKPYIYVPLQYQPEENTSPIGDVYVDQILMIETLSAALPKEWSIYVKEHPLQWVQDGMRYNNMRYKGYYKHIANFSNVFLVSEKINTYRLINRAKAVATVTGTAGFEAVLRQKPSLIFGYPWYRNLKSILRVQSYYEVRQAINKIISGFTINQQDIINYLKCLDEATIHCYIDDFNETNSTFTKPERLEVFAKAVIKEIHNLLNSK